MKKGELGQPQKKRNLALKKWLKRKQEGERILTCEKFKRLAELDAEASFAAFLDLWNYAETVEKTQGKTTFQRDDTKHQNRVADLFKSLSKHDQNTPGLPENLKSS